MRITNESLQELIDHKGHLKHTQINATGILRLALDLHEARERIAELEHEIKLAAAPEEA